MNNPYVLLGVGNLHPRDLPYLPFCASPPTVHYFQVQNNWVKVYFLLWLKMIQSFLSYLKLLLLELEGSLLLDHRKTGPFYFQVRILNMLFHRNIVFFCGKYSWSSSICSLNFENHTSPFWSLASGLSNFLSEKVI